jgi:hypothetical protein
MLFFGDVDYCSDDNSLNYVDIWGHNAYNRYDYNSYFCYYDKISAKPLIITEFGVDAYNKDSSSEYQDVQAEWVVHEWEQIKNNSAGGIVMEYSDEWWKRCGYPSSHDFCGYDTDVQPDSYSNEEWYGVMAVQDNGNQPDIMCPREVYYALQQLFRETIDIGLRVYDGTEIVTIACELEGTLTSPLRIAKNSVVYGIVLVEPSDPAASKLKIQTSSGIRALRKF